jgi:hypothetical protein
MRLASSIKLGFYPTPQEITDYLRDRIPREPGHKTTALDPCAGGGKALARVAPDNTIAYGIEPDRERYILAKDTLNQALDCSIEDATIAHNSFSLLYLNPPYDYQYDNDAEEQSPEDFRRNHKTKRKEIFFLQRTLPYLAPRGLLIYIVPEHILDKHCNEWLSSRLDNIEAYRFPKELYPEFKQILIIGNKKPDKPQPAPATITLRDWINPSTQPLTLPPTTPVKLFRANKLSREAVIEMIIKAQANIEKPLYPENPNDKPTPHAPLPLHLGHLSLMLASGKINGIIKPGTPERHIIRGSVNKQMLTTQSIETTENSAVSITKHRDTYNVSVKILTPDGNIQTLT